MRAKRRFAFLQVKTAPFVSSLSRIKGSLLAAAPTIVMLPEVNTGERKDSRDCMRISEMDPRHWHRIAAVSGIAALGLGTYGFHMFKPEKSIFKEVWQTASLYHLVHTAALLAAPLTKRPHIFGGLLTAGILAFSGSCYTAAYLEDRNYSALAPLGGFAFVAGWASLLF